MVSHQPDEEFRLYRPAAFASASRHEATRGSVVFADIFMFSPKLFSPVYTTFFFACFTPPFSRHFHAATASPVTD
jgi:hypothetical protein